MGAAGAAALAVVEAAAVDVKVVQQGALLGVQPHALQPVTTAVSTNVHKAVQVVARGLVGVLVVESVQDRTIRIRRKRKMQNERETMAKAKAYLDIQAGKSAQDIVTEYIETIGEATEEQMIHTIFQAVYTNKGPVEVLSELAKRYPDQKELIAQLRIALYISLNPQPANLYESIQEFQKEYGEARDILLMELDYLVSHNFMNPERMQYILAKLNESGE